jgi:hypothetical protein
MNLSDETLMAFADGALAPEEAARVAAAVDADPALARKLDRMRRSAEALKQAFAGQLDIETPQNLQDVFKAAPQQGAKVISFPRAIRAPASWITAAAACAALAFFAGRTSLGGGAMMVADADGGLVARGALDRALDRQGSGAEEKNARVGIAMSFPQEGGGYCRVFRTQSASGLACGEAGDWRIESLSAEEHAPSTSGYQVAAGPLPDAILAAANERRAGDPLDSKSERRALQDRWR